jgi:hypothetical protein
MLRDLIKYIVSLVEDEGGTLGVTRLVKLLYLIDVEYYRRHRKLLSDLEWIFYYYGPYALEIPDMLRGLDLEIPQEEKIIGDGRSLHQLKSDHPLETDIGTLLPAPDVLLIDRVVKRWAIEDLNKLLSYVYFDTEPMEDVSLGKPLNFDRIPKVVSRKSIREAELGLTEEETIRFRAMLNAHKLRRSNLLKMAEDQYHKIHATIDPIYEKAMRQAQDDESTNIPAGIKVAGPPMGEKTGFSEMDEDG